MHEEQENWGVLQQLFYLAEETPEEQREKVLREHCADPMLVMRALEIFHSFTAADQVASREQTSHQSPRIGPYTLLRQIGAGGIGTVYLAERIAGGVPQRFALKMLAPHAAGDSFIERFHREQHILASLDHPNITRLIDAGIVASSQHYLVMEFVNGQHLDAYCDDRQLGIADRLRLFLDVCDAVAYAHRNLIVHLDLKPSNILVSQDGAVKLLDFGTSKLIQPDSLLTTTVLATPGYASPEQLRNEPVTTACDVYALGAILFQLLTGRRPYANSSVAAMVERAITEQRPESLLQAITAQGAQSRGVSEQKLRQIIEGDLQTIVQKCLESKSSDRYVSVDALAQDVRRWLGGEPVLARRQTAIYLLGKFVRRHRVGVAAGLTAVTLLVGTLSYAAWRQQQALREARRAEQMQVFMHQLFRIANSNYTGKPAVTVPEFLRLGVKILPDYVRNPADLLQAKIGLAESMFDDGDLDGAKEIFKQTSAAAKSLGNVDAEAESDAFAGHIAFSQGDVNNGKLLTAEALRLSRRPDVSPLVRVKAADYYAWNRENLGFLSDEDLGLLRYAADEARRNNLPLHEKADAIHELASNLEWRGKVDEAQGLYEEVMALLKQDPASVCDQAEIDGEIADLKELRLDFQGALPLWQQAYSGYSECSGADGREALSMLSYETYDLTQMGRAQEAVSLLEPSKAYWEKLPDPYGRWGAFAYALATAYVGVGRYKEAEVLISSRMKVLEPITSKWSQGGGEELWAAALAGQHRYEEALIHANNASEDWSTIPPSVTLNPEGYKRLSDLSHLTADIRAHLSTTSQNPANDQKSSAGTSSIHSAK